MATDTTVTRKVLGTAAPNFGNKPLVFSEMRRIADCLTILAATPAADMDTLAVAMADTVRSA